MAQFPKSPRIGQAFLADSVLYVWSGYQWNIYNTWQDPTVVNKNEETKMFYIDKYWNIVADMIVDLTKK